MVLFIRLLTLEREVSLQGDGEEIFPASLPGPPLLPPQSGLDMTPQPLLPVPFCWKLPARLCECSGLGFHGRKPALGLCPLPAGAPLGCDLAVWASSSAFDGGGCPGRGLALSNALDRFVE